MLENAARDGKGPFATGKVHCKKAGSPGICALRRGLEHGRFGLSARIRAPHAASAPYAHRNGACKDPHGRVKACTLDLRGASFTVCGTSQVRTNDRAIPEET